MKLASNRFYVSTVADDAADVAGAYGFGIEVAEFCTAYNMDEKFGEVKPKVDAEISGASRLIFHAPFNELYPSAIDPQAVKLAAGRFDQAVKLAASMNIKKLVIHSGYVPTLYFRSWFLERSVIFWKDFLPRQPQDLRICLENVLENGPEELIGIVKAVDDPRLRLCYDIGHAHADGGSCPDWNSSPSRPDVYEWLEMCAPYISHFHIHNNDGRADEHQNLGDGTIDVKRLLDRAAVLCPEATFTIETMHAAPSAQWLRSNGFIG